MFLNPCPEVFEKQTNKKQSTAHTELPLRKGFQQSVSARATPRALGLTPRYRNSFWMSVGLDLLKTHAPTEGTFDFHSSLPSLPGSPRGGRTPGHRAATVTPSCPHPLALRLAGQAPALTDLWKTLQLPTTFI